MLANRGTNGQHATDAAAMTIISSNQSGAGTQPSQQDATSTLVGSAKENQQVRRRVHVVTGGGRNETRMAHDRPQQATNFQRQETIDILLDRNNFILFNRCSNNRVYVRVDRRRRRGFIGAHRQRAPQRFAADDDESSLRRKRDAARLKMLSMIITVEPVDRTGERETEHEQQARVAPTPPPQASDQQARPKSTEVRLRANLTELYICLNQRSGNIETRVSNVRGNGGARVLDLDHPKLSGARPLIFVVKIPACPRSVGAR